jgi:hypothetical protein
MDMIIFPPNGRNQGQAGFVATSFDEPEISAARLNFGKPRCPLVP